MQKNSLPRKINSVSVKDTHAFAERLVMTLFPGAVVGLIGDLGSGKTTFVQGVAQALGVSESITSPTFVLWKQYQLADTKFDTLHHLDLYRLDSEEEVLQLGIEELFQQNSDIVFVEWADKFKTLFPKDMLWLSFKEENETSREIRVLRGKDQLDSFA